MAKQVEHKGKKTAGSAPAPRSAKKSPKKQAVSRPGREKFLPV